MRPIKFRAWDNNRKEWLDPPYFSMTLDGATIKHKAGGTKASVELMQFTGLHDKNGTAIYEGDILTVVGETRRNEISEPGVVMWFHAHARWAVKLKHGMTAFYPFEKEVIGNIHENPDLLKETP